MAGGYGSTHGIISSSVKGDAFKGFKLMSDVIYNDLLKANPAPAKPKSPGLAPKPGSSINVDLTTEGLYEMLAPKLKDIELQAAKVDENGEETAPALTLSINLDKDKFVFAIKDLSGCGVYTANASIARGKNWFVGIDGDVADAFVVLFGYLHSELTSESNAAAIKTAVKALDMNFAQRIAVSFIVSIALSSSADGALRTLVLMIPIVKVGVKIASWFGAFKK